MATARVATRRSRRSGRSGTTASSASFLSQRRLLQLGSLAAALGSVLGLVLTVGDRVSGLFNGSDAAPRVHIDRVSLETMPLRTFLVSKKNQNPSDTDYSKEELGRRVVVVNLDARYAHSSRQVSFPARLTLETRTANHGHPVVAAGPLSVTYYLDAANDQCGCSEYFTLPRGGREYRAEIQILEPNTSHPMADATSAWYSL